MSVPRFLPEDCSRPRTSGTGDPAKEACWSTAPRRRSATRAATGTRSRRSPGPRRPPGIDSAAGEQRAQRILARAAACRRPPASLVGDHHQLRELREPAMRPPHRPATRRSRPAGGPFGVGWTVHGPALLRVGAGAAGRARGRWPRSRSPRRWRSSRIWRSPGGRHPAQPRWAHRATGTAILGTATCADWQQRLGRRGGWRSIGALGIAATAARPGEPRRDPRPGSRPTASSSGPAPLACRAHSCSTRSTTAPPRSSRRVQDRGRIRLLRGPVGPHSRPLNTKSKKVGLVRACSGRCHARLSFDKPTARWDVFARLACEGATRVEGWRGTGDSDDVFGGWPDCRHRGAGRGRGRSSRSSSSGADPTTRSRPSSRTPASSSRAPRSWSAASPSGSRLRHRPRRPRPGPGHLHRRLRPYAPLRRGNHRARSAPTRSRGSPTARSSSTLPPAVGQAGPEIPDGGTLPESETTSEVDLDQLFNTLNATHDHKLQARDPGLRALLRGRRPTRPTPAIKLPEPVPVDLARRSSAS